MAYAVTAYGAQECGAGVATGLVAATGATIFGPFHSEDRQPMAVNCTVVATGAFNLDYQFTPDGVNWYTGPQEPSSATDVDSGVAGYPYSVRVDMSVGRNFRLQVYNLTGSPINFAYEFRYYSDSG